MHPAIGAPTGAVMSIDALPAARRTGAWRDAVCATFVRLECTPERHAPLHGRIESRVLGDLHVARVTSSPQQVQRTAARAASADEAFVLMSVQLRGRTVVRQDSMEADLRPGSIAFYDTTRPYTLTLPADFDQIVMHLPHAALERAVPGGLDCMARCIGAANPFAQALVAIAPQLMHLTATLPPALVERTAAAAQELIALALASLTQVGSGNAAPRLATTGRLGARSDALVWRARDVMGRRLHQADLTPAAVAAEVGVSLRRLQEAFQAQGCTVADTLWDMRLEMARALLGAAARVSIGGVAQRAGFVDPAHFSHRFRQRYGLSPRDYRQAARGA